MIPPTIAVAKGLEARLQKAEVSIALSACDPADTPDPSWSWHPHRFSFHRAQRV
mgnify:CR=1 FL=1